jgi:predicted PurR-regulated permease PerM
MAMRRDQPAVMRPGQTQDLAAVASILTGVIIVASLYLARDVLIPLALAVLISFVLAPMAHGLRRVGVPRVPAVLAVVVLSFGAILGVGALGTSQISQLAENLSQYQSNIRDKIRAVKISTSGNGPVSRATSVIADIGQEISASTHPQPGATVPAPILGSRDGTPVPVEIRSSSTYPFILATEYLQAIFSPLASTLLVVLFVIFFLLQQEDLRDRVIRLLGPRELHRTTEAMQEAARGLSKYFLLQTALNALSGLVIGLGLWLIGVPSPVLWGIFTMLMRFVPYIGAVLAAVLPIALAAAVDPGWDMVIWTAVLFIVAESVMGQIIEPTVFGHQTGLSPVAIMVAATFWTWLWGPIGLILATPLTMCLVILGQYTKRLEFLHVLLGDQPALTPPQSFYQRLIAGDPAEIIDQAERQLKDVELLDYYDDVALPGLVLAQRDVSNGELPAERQALLFDGVSELIDGLADNEASLADPAILCVAGRGSVDHAAAALQVQLLNRAGLVAQLGGEQGGQALTALPGTNRHIELVCVSYVGTARLAQVRYMVRRIRRLYPGAKVLVGLWRMPPGDPDLQPIKDSSGADLFAQTFRDALAQCGADVAKNPQRAQAQQPGIATGEQAHHITVEPARA